jgi:DNA polymerase-1
MRAEIAGISFSLKSHQAFYLPLKHSYPGAPEQLNLFYVLEKLKSILEEERIRKYGQNLKYDLIVLQNHGIELKGIACDTMIASYLLNPSKHNHNLEEIAREYLNHQMITYQEVAGKGKTEINFKEVDLEKAKTYSCEDADVAYLLNSLLVPRIKEENLDELFCQIEIPLIYVLARMEMNGVKIDPRLLEEMSRQLDVSLRQCEEKIYQMAGEPFNINSPQQLGKILFEKLKLPKGKKIKTGYSTDVRILTKLAREYDLPQEVLGYRSLAKLKSTYIDALPKLINPKTDRIHTSYNQTVTATGRLSSSDPNLQNIPIRTEEGRKIREAFIPEDGWKILSADYSQIELRVLAHLSRDEGLISAFKNGEDIHKKTATEVFDVLPSMVTSQMRRMAKLINFGIIYGMKAFSLSEELRITNKEAQNYIDTYFKRYRRVKEYHESTLQKAKDKGYVTTLLNRRRYIPEIESGNRLARESAERTAINAPIQGTAADLIKLAMINISRKLSQLNLVAKMIMQVHDELIFEVPEEELERVIDLVREEMERVTELCVPLKVEINTGKNWAEAH